MDLGLSGSVAVIFGAASGIGAAIARAFAAEGAQVAAVDRASSVLDLASQLPRCPGPGGRRDRLRRGRPRRPRRSRAASAVATTSFSPSVPARASSAFHSGNWSRPTGTACSRST